MSRLVRSPSGGGINDGSGGSQPNLSALATDNDNPQITFRNKRKLHTDNDQIVNELSDLRKEIAEMMIFMRTTSSTQSENISKLRQDITDIKSQVNTISNNMATMSTEQDKLRTDVQRLVASTEATEERIKLLESDINLLKSSSPGCTNQTPITYESYDKLINECQERNIRNKNIVIAGIIESTAENAAERLEHDTQEVLKITKMVLNDCPDPQQIFRLGKYQPNKNRVIKVCFTSENVAKQLLRNKKNVKLNNIKIYSDQTPYQREVLKKLQQELQQRTENGECNLLIKYEKGVPKIIKSQPKNSTATEAKS
ncbi:uncharacterized protein LOC133523842 [Cydia pomonella]|uniref:uncharacterized protein LOC133523842 n=1 Tax=Cydia pomonella TaxID=82600 RepID=UPI002ADDDBD9|nr:uncharacterized protein LOC133523842 [Cydia pomonella]